MTKAQKDAFDNSKNEKGRQDGAKAFDYFLKCLKAEYALDGYAGAIRQASSFANHSTRAITNSMAGEYPDFYKFAIGSAAEVYLWDAPRELRALERKVAAKLKSGYLAEKEKAAAKKAKK